MADGILSPLAYSDLLDRLTDPDSDLDHYFQYLLEFQPAGELVPDLHPNPLFVTDIPPRLEGGIGMGLANAIMRSRRHKAYRKRIRKGWTGHRIVSEGDSWFQYPTQLKDIIDHLMVDHAILSLGAAGDELKDIQRQREILVNLQAEDASALLLSGGGNDLFANGQLGQLVEEPFEGATAEDLVGDACNAFLRQIFGRFLAVFTRVHSALPHVHILVHGYGPAFPSGGDWIEKPLTDRGVAPDIQHDVVKLILKRFNAGLARLAKRSEFHGKIAHLDVTDIGTKRSDWHDEIHLNGPNAAKVASRFRTELAKRLGAPSVERGVALDATDTVVHQAQTLSALDDATLLQELDLRVALIEMDPSVANEVQLAPLALGRAAPEIGLASLRDATHRLIRNAQMDLRDVICGGRPETAIERAIVEAIDKGKFGLAGVIAAWLVQRAVAVPAVLASALGAWLAGKVIALGTQHLCSIWQPDGASAPAVIGGAIETSAATVGELRARFETPAGQGDFSADGQKGRLAQLDHDLAKDVVEAPRVPVDALGASRFRKNAATIYAMLGGEADDVPLEPAQFGTAEAMVMIDGSRCAPYVRDGFVDLSDPKIIASGFLDKITQHEASIRALTAASGRIIRGPDRSANQVFGSAWMLPDGRVATARHVLEAMAIESAGKWFFKDIFYVDFAVEADRDIQPKAVFRIAEVAWAGPDEIAGQVIPSHLDAAILTLVPDDARAFPDPVPVTAATQALASLDEGWFINVGHPAQPFGSWLVDTDDGSDKTISKSLVHALIGDKFGVKRLSPGRIQFKPGMFPDDTETKHIFTHDATTLGGSSGSALMSMDPNASILGLHFAGLFGTRNYAHFVTKISESWR
ncbi:trypsin-like peptidase domain-containing protein [Algirhabdus cladophorae]|uniref:trypsin-like peptidase domain-containing protein n=1 Tax=Algirhabdus cladophorae TaxID=3377108 RepID=UPI003B84A902